MAVVRGRKATATHAALLTPAARLSSTSKHLRRSRCVHGLLLRTAPPVYTSIAWAHGSQPITASICHAPMTASVKAAGTRSASSLAASAAFARCQLRSRPLPPPPQRRAAMLAAAVAAVAAAEAAKWWPRPLLPPPELLPRRSRRRVWRQSRRAASPDVPVDFDVYSYDLRNMCSLKSNLYRPTDFSTARQVDT